MGIKLSCFSLESMSDNTTDVGDDILYNMENNATVTSTNNDITPSADSIGQFLTEIRNYISPFTLTILLGGSLFCVLIFAGFCLVARINAKPRRRCKSFQRMDSVASDQWVRARSYSGHTTLSNVSRSNLGVLANTATNNNILPNLGLSSPNNYSLAVPSSTVTLHRVSSYTSPYCLSPRTPTNPSSSSVMTSYPVVTPSATSFAGPRPVPVSLTLPHANYSNYCTAGLYQNRLRSPPRPLSCIAGINVANIELPKAKISNTSSPQGRFERDYMSIAEVSEQKSAKVIGNAAHNEQTDDDLNEVEATDKNEVSRRSSVYL